MKFVQHEVPEVVKQFSNWYQQLSSQDKTILDRYLSNKYSQSSRSSKAQPHFKGRIYGQAPRNSQQKTLIECNQCGNIIEIG